MPLIILLVIFIFASMVPAALAGPKTPARAPIRHCTLQNRPANRTLDAKTGQEVEWGQNWATSYCEVTVGKKVIQHVDLNLPWPATYAEASAAAYNFLHPEEKAEAETAKVEKP